jgi:hypothetical protein
MSADRLLLIKNYYVPDIPTKEDLEEAKQICIKENCAIELRWCPNIWAGWYHIYIYNNSNIDEVYDTQVPKVYGV